MDEQSKKRKRISTKVWVRILAGFLALTLALFIIMIDLTRVKINTEVDNEAADAAAALLAERTEYIEKNVFARAGDVLTNMFTTPKTFSSYYMLASMQIAQSKYEQALVNIERCLAQYRGDDLSILDDLWMKKGCLQTLQDDYPGALISFSGISDMGSGTPEILRIKIQIYIETQDLPNAKTALLAYLNESPGDLSMRTLLAEVYYLNGDYKLGAAQYTYLIKATGDSDGSLHFMRGLLASQMGEYEPAIADFVYAVGADFEDPAACCEQQALCYYMLKKNELTLSLGKKAIDIGSDNIDPANLYKFMGLSALTLGYYEESSDHFSEAIAHDSTIEDLHFYRGVARMGDSEFTLAIEDFSASINADQMCTSCYYNRAICYIQVEDFGAAKFDLSKVAEQSDDSALADSAEELLEQMNDM